MDWDLLLEALGVTLGLIYLFWEYKADARMWIVSAVMPLISMWIYFSKGIYADFAINIYYFFMAIYGFWNWRRPRRDVGGRNEKLPITHTPPLSLLGCVAVMCALWAMIAWVLINFTDSTIPYVDAFTTAMSIVGMWMASQKYIEQWWVWLIVNVVTVPMQIYKGLVFYPCLYTVYAVVSVMGYFKWRRLMLRG